MTPVPARYHFGGFTLCVPQMVLERDGQAVRLGGRALNLLAVLAEAAGALVPRETLLERIWPGQAIDESVIRVHLSSARKVLQEGGAGERAIVNEAGRGYRLALPVSRDCAGGAVPVRPAPAVEPAAPALSMPPRLPLRLGSIWGRDPVLTRLALELEQRRLVTIAGPGGIGKTTLALAVAQQLARTQGTSAWFVDFAPLAAGSDVAATLAATLGLPGPDSRLTALMAAMLAQAPALVILDNCEHVIEAVAPLVEDMLRSIPALTVLATSREPLRAEGEWVHRLAALEVPREQDALPLEQAALYPAIALFAERASAVNAAFAMDEASLPAIIEICRRLDGIPLAIELAAARCDAMDPAMIARALDDRFNLLARGRRSALPRHQTLRGALDWSYALLDTQAQALLDGLCVFRAGFDAHAATRIAAATGLDASAAMAALADLVAKSLVHGTATPEGMRYRLLDTTRHYGLERLEQGGVERAAREAHARCLLAILAGSHRAWEGKARRDWLVDASAHIDDARAALIWAIAEDRARDLAEELTIASAPLWFHLSLPEEFIGHAAALLARPVEEAATGHARPVELLMSYGHALWHTRGPTADMGQAFAQALAQARSMGRADLVLRALWGVWAHRILAGHYTESLDLAGQFMDLALLDPSGGDSIANRQTAEHMLALSHHFRGDHGSALRHLARVLSGDAAPERANHANHAQIDGRIAATSLMMRLEWLRADGDLLHAMDLAKSCADDLGQLDHALSACYGLAIGCIPVALAAGERDLARDWLGELEKHSARHGLEHWHMFAAGYRGGMDAAPDTLPTPLSGASRMQQEMFAVAAGHSADIPWARMAPFTTLPEA